MEEGNVNESVPDLKDLEVKIGRKTPEGLLKWMREESAHRGEAKSNIPECIERDPARKSLDEKIRKLKVEMVRSVRAKVILNLIYIVILIAGFMLLRLNPIVWPWSGHSRRISALLSCHI